MFGVSAAVPHPTSVVCATFTPPRRRSCFNLSYLCLLSVSQPAPLPPSLTLCVPQRDVTMEYENKRAPIIDAAMRACLPADRLLKLMAIGLEEAIEIMLDDPVASTDVCTLLVAYTPGTTNCFPRYHVKLWHDLVAIRVLQRFNVQATPPPVFRNWLGLADDSGARRRRVLLTWLMMVNRECMVGGTRVLYEKVLYHLCNTQLPGVTARMVQPDGMAPDMADAQAHDYYALRFGRKVSADGLPHDGRPKHCVKVFGRLCLFVMAGTVLDAFTNTWRHMWGVGVRVAFAEALRAMVLDESFEWDSTAPADHPAGPGTWRLLLPSRRERAACDVRVQTMSEKDMQGWDDM